MAIQHYTPDELKRRIRELAHLAYETSPDNYRTRDVLRSIAQELNMNESDIAPEVCAHLQEFAGESLTMPNYGVIGSKIFTVDFVYTLRDMLPTKRHKNPVDVPGKQGRITIRIPVIDSDSAPLAGILHLKRYEFGTNHQPGHYETDVISIRWFDGKLYTPVALSKRHNEKYFSGSNIPLGPAATYKLMQKQDYVDSNREHSETIQRLLNHAGDLIVIEGNIWTRCPMPIYHVAMLPGTGFVVSLVLDEADSYKANEPFINYFSAARFDMASNRWHELESLLHDYSETDPVKTDGNSIDVFIPDAFAYEQGPKHPDHSNRASCQCAACGFNGLVIAREKIEKQIVMFNIVGGTHPRRGDLQKKSEYSQVMFCPECGATGDETGWAFESRVIPLDRNSELSSNAECWRMVQPDAYTFKKINNKGGDSPVAS